MLSKNKAKQIRQLHDKKHRTELGLFLVEGEKSVVELLQSDFTIESLFITSSFHTLYKELLKDTEYSIVEQPELENIGTLESNNAALAVVFQKENTSLSVEQGEIVLALDTVRDPGNLGTIIRIADWYGITKIVCSETTVDQYNGKVISATKGSFTRVNLFYTDLHTYLHEQKNKNIPILAAFLEGEDVHSLAYPQEGILLMGSESHGIAPEYIEIVTKKVTIPSFGKAESLNVSIATAIIVDNWRRSI
jgi:TrmH family RNA methyltransferase